MNSQSEPFVCALMLTRDRPAMMQRAVRSFRSQTYANKALFILDTGKTPCGLKTDDNETSWYVREVNDRPVDKISIGELRNLALGMMSVLPLGTPDIFVHFDDDDWSHPNRIAEQVGLLQASGAEAVGYNEMLFWDTRGTLNITSRSDPGEFQRDVKLLIQNKGGLAWLYRYPNPCYALGTSLCYWRKTWERVTFDHISHGEDERWLKRVRGLGISSVRCNVCGPAGLVIKDDGHGGIIPLACPACNGTETIVAGAGNGDARMVAELHGGNTHNTDPAEKRAMFRRVPEWDAYCRKEMGS